jgi:hypothetical protein
MDTPEHADLNDLLLGPFMPILFVFATFILFFLVKSIPLCLVSWFVGLVWSLVSLASKHAAKHRIFSVVLLMVYVLPTIFVIYYVTSATVA